MNTMFTRWLPAIAESSVTRRIALGVAGVGVAAGAVAGPVTVVADPPAVVTPAAVVSTVEPAGAPAGKPGTDQLIPHGVRGEQSHIEISDEQRDSAAAIVAATKQAGMDERAAVIAVATSMQESKLQNLGDLGERNDHDSQGLFQQRPSSGWGTVEQITDPRYATTAFLQSLKQVHGWQDMPLTDAAQKVQVSAFPDAYAQWETQAAELVADLW